MGVRTDAGRIEAHGRCRCPARDECRSCSVGATTTKAHLDFCCARRSRADLKVSSRTSTAKYKSKPEDLKTVSQQLGVATVLEGSVQKASSKVRVNVQFIDARADSHLWAKTYDRDIQDIFAVESEVAQEIADSLQAKLAPAEASTLATAPTKDPAAHDLFLKGEHEERLAESSLKPESYEQAAAWYRQAIARDPNFALPMARRVE